MATQDEILTVPQMKTELRFPAGEDSHDSMIAAQIADALAWIASYTGLALSDLATDDKRLPIIRRAAVVLTRDAYDGHGVVPQNHAAFSVLGPIRKIGAVSVEV